MRPAILLCLFLSACAYERGYHIGVGSTVSDALTTEIAEADLIGKYYKTWGVVRVDVGEYLAWKIYDIIRVDLGLSLAQDYTWTQDAFGTSLNLWLRPRLDLGDLEPYLIASHGIGTWYPDFEGQGTNWGFPTMFGLGTRVALDRFTYLTIDYRFFHESNGSAFFGKDLLPNPGFNTDALFIGLEFVIP